MAEFRFHLRRRDGKPFCLLYSSQTSELLWEETGERVSLHSIGIGYDLNPSRQWSIAKVVSPGTPLSKSRALRALKIQLGLKCNGHCGYCNQTAHSLELYATLS